MNFLFFLSQHRTDAMTTFFRFITHFGEETIVILFLCFLFWCKNKNFAYRLSLGYFFSGLCVQGLKVLFQIPRPWLLDPEFHAVPQAIPKATGFSFPSGHTQNVTTLFGFLGYASKKWVGQFLCALMICLVGFSRMYLGVHTPKDVLVSFLLSIGIIICVTLFYHPETISPKADLFLSFLFAFFSLLIIAICSVLYLQGSIELRYLADCSKAAGAGLGFSAAYYLERTHIKFTTSTDRIWQQFFKYGIGLFLTFILKEGIKVALGTSLVINGLRYFILIFWVIAIWPWIFMRLFHPSRKNLK